MVAATPTPHGTEPTDPPDSTRGRISHDPRSAPASHAWTATAGASRAGASFLLLFMILD